MSLPQSVLHVLARQAIELPSWAFGNSGTRFKVFAQRGVPRTPQEKIADAAQVHALTGLALGTTAGTRGARIHGSAGHPDVSRMDRRTPVE